MKTSTLIIIAVGLGAIGVGFFFLTRGKPAASSPLDGITKGVGGLVNTVLNIPDQILGGGGFSGIASKAVSLGVDTALFVPVTLPVAGAKEVINVGKKIGSIIGGIF